MTKKQKIQQLKKQVQFLQDFTKVQAKSFNESIDKITKLYESQLDIQDKAIQRQQIIIRYLEEKCLKVYE